MAIRTDAVDAYFDQLRPQRSAVMTEMEALAERDSIPIVSWETGRLLAALAAAADGRVLEVGTAIGYSTLHMAEALDAGSIVTLERDPDRIAQARDFLDRGGVGRPGRDRGGRRARDDRLADGQLRLPVPGRDEGRVPRLPGAGRARCWRHGHCWRWTTC